MRAFLPRLYMLVICYRALKDGCCMLRNARWLQKQLATASFPFPAPIFMTKGTGAVPPPTRTHALPVYPQKSRPPRPLLSGRIPLTNSPAPSSAKTQPSPYKSCPHSHSPFPLSPPHQTHPHNPHHHPCYSPPLHHTPSSPQTPSQAQLHSQTQSDTRPTSAARADRHTPR